MYVMGPTVLARSLGTTYWTCLYLKDPNDCRKNVKGNKKKKKTKEKTYRTVSTFFLLSIAAVSQSVRAFASGSLGVQFPAATDLSRKNIICYIIAKLHYQTLGNRYECHLSSEMTNLYERFISKNI